MIVLERKIGEICTRRGMTREEFDEFVQESLAGGAVRLKDGAACLAKLGPETQQPPGLLQRAVNFAASAIRHVGEGAPRCTEEEVAARFAICQVCEHYTGSVCRKCGCGVSGRRGLVSKLSWAGESCPVEKWGPVARDENG